MLVLKKVCMDQINPDESPLHELVQLRQQYAELKAVHEKNIAVQKQTDEALQQSEHKFFALFEKSAFPASLSKLTDGTIVEVNEAFAAQVIAVNKAMKDKDLAQRFGLTKAWGEIPAEKLNVNGGAIALGHPVGSTGSRLLITLAHELKRRKAGFGVASLCIGGGQGGACIIENLKK